MENRWEHYPHLADMGIRGIGATPAEAFEQAALALTAVVADPASIQLEEGVKVECQSPDRELLLVDWLNAVIYEMATRKMLFGSFAVRINGEKLIGEARGERVDPIRHDPAVEIKGATVTTLSVRQEPGGPWIAQCVVDV